MSDTPRTNEAEREGLIRGSATPTKVIRADFARTLELEIAELLERLNERTESHVHASKRDVQTIQQHAVEIDRLKGVNAEMLESLTSLCSYDSTCGCGVSNDEAQRWFKACALVAREKGETK